MGLFGKSHSLPLPAIWSTFPPPRGSRRNPSAAPPLPPATALLVEALPELQPPGAGALSSLCPPGQVRGAALPGVKAAQGPALCSPAGQTQHKAEEPQLHPDASGS